MSWQKTTHEILEAAADEDRFHLYEHEVYTILDSLGQRTPVWHLLQQGDEVSLDLLADFGSERVVLKVVSSGVAHKQKLGGVKIAYKDLDYIRFQVDAMRSAFLEEGYPVAGVLMVEHVPYEKDLGNEILMGFRESVTFGPVLSFSKGGADAEHFAENFSPPNLLLPPIDSQWSEALLSSTKIHKKYLAEGKQSCIEQIVDLQVKIGELATAFSNFFDPDEEEGRKKTGCRSREVLPGYVLKEFEVNPFVFDEDGRLIALDGYAVFEVRRGRPGRRALKPASTMQPFFRPRGIAVVGVSSSDHNKAGNIILKNLIELGRDDVYAVNPRGGNVSVAGKDFQLYREVSGISGQVDLVVITVPASASLPVVREAVEKKARAVLLIPGGFSEATGSSSLEQEILEIIEGSQTRIMGPNCLGVVYAGAGEEPGLNTFFIPEEKFQINLDKDKNVAILSQSGALGIVEIYNLRNAVSPRVIVSYGNQLDVDPCDLAAYFADDPEVDVIGLYIEGFLEGAGRDFFDITRNIKKPVVVYKAGRTEAGMMATQSHTASMSGEYAVARAAMKQAGLVVADTMTDHSDFIKAFAMMHDREVRGNRVAVITNAGYEKTNAADNIGDLKLAELDRETEEKLRDLLPGFVSVEPLLDLTPMVPDETFAEAARLLVESENVDALLVSIVPQAALIHTTDREISEYKQNIAAQIVEVARSVKKPIAVSVTVTAGADAVYNRLAQVMDNGRVPTYLSAERAMMCLREFIRYKLIKEQNRIREWLE
ncbi:MAG: acetate--CoA ligase family protein [Spirochaetales bacterium]|nr:acetate--CoA ligase family protein [Spirochaetales bacterium]MCF7938924.1 acetate--CoA ligase family protein [Spirochaetales bacterium]